MKNLSVWYHCKISGDGIPDPNFAFNVMVEQMETFKKCGLAEAASEIHIGVNGGDGDALLVSALGPPKALLHVHGKMVKSELPTQHLIQRWLTNHPDWYVLYFHTKGVTHPTEELYVRWRHRMEHACLWNWKQCVTNLDQGYEAVGCHWLTPEKFPSLVTSPFFGGTFWWTTAKYLMQLPKLPEPSWANRFEAESWIGRRRPYPRVMDYYPGWP